MTRYVALLRGINVGGSRLIAKATQSQLVKLLASPIYPQLTIRNWNTTVKLRDLLNG